MIYFVQPVDGGPIKIGTTEYLETRLHQLESHYGKPFALLATMPGGRDEEQEMHARFSHLRFRRTEQFRPGPDLMDFIGKPLLVAANPDAVEIIKPLLSGIQIAEDVLDLARKLARYHGYRGQGAVGRFLTDILRPILDEMERDLIAEWMKELGMSPSNPEDE